MAQRRVIRQTVHTEESLDHLYGLQELLGMAPGDYGVNETRLLEIILRLQRQVRALEQCVGRLNLGEDE